MSEPTDGRCLIGVLTPSSNTRLEPLTHRMLDGLPDVSAHFSRFRVVDVGLGAANQFETDRILAAADLLADAHVDVMVWSGTSGGWRGIQADRDLCAAITATTGVPATTSTLALLEALRWLEASTLGLVTPYPEDMHRAVVSTLGGQGVTIRGAENLDVTRSNFELSLITPGQLEPLIARVAADRPEAISTFCTNLGVADRVAAWEAAFGCTILDTVALAVWHALVLAGRPTSPLAPWGRLFTLEEPS